MQNKCKRICGRQPDIKQILTTERVQQISTVLSPVRAGYFLSSLFKTFFRNVNKEII